MGLTLTTAARNALANAITTLIDAGSGAGYCELWTAAFATKLGTVTFSDPSFGAASTGVITASAITDDTSADASGTATVFKIFDSTAAEVLRGTIGTSGAEIIFANGNVFTAGQTIHISSFTFTMPAT